MLDVVKKFRRGNELRHLVTSGRIRTKDETTKSKLHTELLQDDSSHSTFRNSTVAGNYQRFEDTSREEDGETKGLALNGPKIFPLNPSEKMQLKIVI